MQAFNSSLLICFPSQNLEPEAEKTSKFEFLQQETLKTANKAWSETANKPYLIS